MIEEIRCGSCLTGSCSTTGCSGRVRIGRADDHILTSSKEIEMYVNNLIDYIADVVHEELVVSGHADSTNISNLIKSFKKS